MEEWHLRQNLYSIWTRNSDHENHGACAMKLYRLLMTLNNLPPVAARLVIDNLRKNSSVQFSSVAQSCLTLCNPMECSMPGFPVHHQLPELTQIISIESVMPSNHLILCRPLSSCLQSFPVSGSFPMSQLFASHGQSIGVSASASVLPVNIQWLPLGWTGWISLQSKGLSRVFSMTTVQKHQFFGAQFLYSPTLTFSLSMWLLEKP